MPVDSLDTHKTDLEYVVRVLRRRWYVVALCALVSTGAALGLSLVASKQYSANAALLFRDAGLDQKLFGATFTPPAQNADREAATNVKLVSLEKVADLTSVQLGAGLTPRFVKQHVDVAGQGQSNLVTVTATTPSPELSARLANTFAKQFVAFRVAADQSKIKGALKLVKDQIAALQSDRTTSRRRQLESRAEELQLLAALQTGNAELVQQADVPGGPSAPRVKRNTAIGFVFGLIIGLGLAFLLDRLDRRVSDLDSIDDLYGGPLLAIVPDDPRLAGSEIGQSSSPAGSYHMVGEEFRMLRSQLRYFNVDRDLKTVAVTSAVPNEGKSTVSWHLAVAAALSGAGRVLLIEADLRRPRLAVSRGIDPPFPGLAEALARSCPVEEAIRTFPLEGGGTPHRLDVLLSGAQPPNPGELIESEAMADLLAQLCVQYDFIVVDTPPTTVVSDALPLLRVVSGVLIVSRPRFSTKAAARRMRTILESLGAHTLGVVANRVSSRRDGYGYGYGYGEGYDDSKHVAGTSAAPTSPRDSAEDVNKISDTTASS